VGASPIRIGEVGDGSLMLPHSKVGECGDLLKQIKAASPQSTAGTNTGIFVPQVQ
jgi:hypothetical protein